MDWNGVSRSSAADGVPNTISMVIKRFWIILHPVFGAIFAGLGRQSLDAFCAC
jgi:hypothetical protein